MHFSFGSGSLWGVNSAANSTPQEFGALQDVTLDFSFNLKELRGQYQFPLAVARGGGKITGKSKFGSIDAKLFNELFFGNTYNTTFNAAAVKEAATVPSATTFTVTVANHDSYISDLGVTFVNTGAKLQRVDVALPETGQYAVAESTGVYTFSSADASSAVLIDYMYGGSNGGGMFALSNQRMGNAPTFAVVLSEEYQGKILTVRLHSCVSNKLALATKLEDFTIPELDFEAMANSANSLGYISVK